MDVSVIVSTYNKPDWLEKVLWGYVHQDHHDFELIIADDGSTRETRELIGSVTAEQVHRAARRLLTADRFCVASVGPPGHRRLVEEASFDF